MVNYKCPRCNYTTIQKTNFKYHLNRKKICKPTISDVSILDIKRYYNIDDCYEIKISAKNIPTKSSFLSSQNPHFIPTKSSFFSDKKNVCHHCEKNFSSYKNRWRHEKYHCKIKKQKDIIDIKNKENKKLKKEIIRLKNKDQKIITNNINKGTINNGTINNITINQFFDTENEKILNRLNNKKMIKYLNNKSYNNLLLLLCKQIYFNDKFPEDNNIKCTNLQSKLCDVFVDDSFKKMPKAKAYEHITDKMAFLIQDIGDENKEKINNKGHKNINLTQETLDNPEKHYETINLELYNNTKNNMNI